MRILFTFLLLILLFSCTTQVTTIKHDQDIALGDEKGYLLLGIQTNRDLKDIYISGPQNIRLTSDDIKEGTNFLLADLDAGIYTITRVYIDRNLPYNLENKDYWTFEVKPGQISYIGHLEIAQRGFLMIQVHVELVNRSSEAVEFLEEKYPNILANRSIVYGGPGNDHFFEHLASKGEE